MRAFVVSVNGKRVGTGGVEDGVLAANITLANSPQKPKSRALVGVLSGGFDTAANEHLEWVQKSLRVGDEVCIRVVETDSIDRPRRQKRRTAAEELREQKRYGRHFAKKLGWTIRTGR